MLKTKNLPNSIEGQVDQLELIRSQIKDLKAEEDLLKELIYENFKEKINSAYKQKDEAFGVVNFKEDKFKISFTTPKKVEWNQDGLKKLYEAGAPIDVEYSVKEVIFKAQDTDGKDAFMPYRTVKPGAISIKVEYDT